MVRRGWGDLDRGIFPRQKRYARFRQRLSIKLLHQGRHWGSLVFPRRAQEWGVEPGCGHDAVIAMEMVRLRRAVVPRLIDALAALRDTTNELFAPGEPHSVRWHTSEERIEPTTVELDRRLGEFRALDDHPPVALPTEVRVLVRDRRAYLVRCWRLEISRDFRELGGADIGRRHVRRGRAKDPRLVVSSQRAQWRTTTCRLLRTKVRRTSGGHRAGGVCLPLRVGASDRRP